MDNIEKVGDNHSEKNKESNNQQGFDQRCHGGSDAIAFKHAIDNRKNKQKHGRDKQNRAQGIIQVPLPVANLAHHFSPSGL
jgi:hypothetical protein